jgi:hypothetical protein
LDRRYSAGGLQGDGVTLRKLYQLLQREALLGPDLVIVWGRDDDGDGRRRDDAMQARQRLPRPPSLLLAIACECGEAWVIAGWSAKHHEDTTLLGELRRQLGFDPCSHPERLSHKHDAPKSAKRVIGTLFGDDEDGEMTALITAISRETSTGCGLQAFCAEVDAWLSGAVQRDHLEPAADPGRGE